LGIDDDTVSPEQILDLKGERSFRQFLPVIVLMFTPITVSYQTVLGPTFSFFFFFGRIDVRILSMYYFTQFSLVYSIAFLAVSLPAFMVTIYSCWELRRLSQKKTTARGALRMMLAAIVAWAIYLVIFFLGSLSVGQLIIGPFPVPLAPLAAILSRGYIVDVTEQIDELENASTL
jgi:hypothetical protein